MKSQIGFLLFLAAAGCAGTVKQPQSPSSIFAGKKFSVLMLQPPSGVPFYSDQLNRIVWLWNESSPWFHDQFVGISAAIPSSSSLPSLLEAMEASLKNRSELLVILQPRKFFLADRGKGSRGSSSYNQGGPLLDEAEFLVSIAEISSQKEIGTFQAKVSRSSDRDDSILDKLAYEIAVKAGFGWRLTE